MIGNSNDETSFRYKLTVTNTQVLKIRNKLLKMVYQLVSQRFNRQSRGFLFSSYGICDLLFASIRD